MKTNLTMAFTLVSIENVHSEPIFSKHKHHIQFLNFEFKLIIFIIVIFYKDFAFQLTQF